MSVKARWGQAPAATSTPDDPFADMGAAERSPADVGTRVTFGNSSRSYLEELTRVVGAIDVLYAAGTTCEIMDRPATSCSVCPLSQVHADGDPMQPLCIAGTRFETLSTQLAVAEQSERDARRG